MSNRPTKRRSSAQRVRDARNQAERSSRAIWIFGAVILAVVVIGLVAVLIARPGGEPEGGGASPSGGTVVPSGDLQYGQVQVQGENLPPRPTSGADPAVGMVLPAIDGQTFDGSALDIDPSDGRPKVVMVLAHWCPHCQAEVPRLQDWLDENGMPSDVDLYAVSTAFDSGRPNAPAGRWLRREGWSVPTMVDDEQGRAASALGASSYPFFVSVDAGGKVVTRTSGEISIQTWEGLLNSARSGGTTGGAGG